MKPFVVVNDETVDDAVKYAKKRIRRNSKRRFGRMIGLSVTNLVLLAFCLVVAYGIILESGGKYTSLHSIATLYTAWEALKTAVSAHLFGFADKKYVLYPACLLVGFLISLLVSCVMVPLFSLLYPGRIFFAKIPSSKEEKARALVDLADRANDFWDLYSYRKSVILQMGDAAIMAGEAIAMSVVATLWTQRVSFASWNALLPVVLRILGMGLVCGILFFLYIWLVLAVCESLFHFYDDYPFYAKADAYWISVDAEEATRREKAYTEGRRLLAEGFEDRFPSLKRKRSGSLTGVLPKAEEPKPERVQPKEERTRYEEETPWSDTDAIQPEAKVTLPEEKLSETAASVIDRMATETAASIRSEWDSMTDEEILSWEPKEEESEEKKDS